MAIAIEMLWPVVRFSAVVIAVGLPGLITPAATFATDAYYPIYTSGAGERPVYIEVGGPTPAPFGWVDFCIRYKPECATKPSTPRDLVLTPEAWSRMVDTNYLVNHTIKPKTDLVHWGVADRWDYPDDGYGDCEDYALLKRRMLMRAGWPREALLITVVLDKMREGHAILTVKTNQGDFILDSQTDKVLPWHTTGYQFVKRQSQSDPNVWVALGSSRDAPSMVAARSARNSGHRQTTGQQ